MALNWRRAVLAALSGIAGTLVFDIMGLFFGMPWWDVPAALAEATGFALGSGVLMH